MSEQITVCWSEIPVTDLKAACEFYSELFDWTMTIVDMGPNKGANFNSSQTSVAGHIYPGKPAKSGTGSTIHFALPGSLEDACERCTQMGGRVVSPPIEIPPGRFAYAEDLDGNSIGLFELKEE